MNSKKILLLAVVGIIFSLTACAPTAAAYQGSSNAPVRQLSVVGDGQVFAAPDIAYINVGVHSQADTVTAALQQNNAQAQAIKDTLVSHGVAQEDIQTSSFNVYPQTSYDNFGNITNTFFSVDNTVYVTVRDLNNLGEVLDAVATSGANNIYGITFNLQDKTSAQSDARALAVDSAQKQAQELADLAGVTLGDIISISTTYSNPVQYYGYGMGGGGAAAVESAVPVSAGQMQIESQVTVVYAIQ